MIRESKALSSASFRLVCFGVILEIDELDVACPH
jgi:hypothetical protein